METFGRIRTKEGKVAPFRMNTVQLIFSEMLAHCWAAGVALRLVLVKSRQQGSSTYWDLLAVAMAELKPGYQAVIIAHDDAGAELLFSKVRTALRNLRKAGWPEPLLTHDQGAMVRWASESGIGAGTIKTGDALGKGGTPNMLHFSESANYADKGNDANRAVNSIKNAMVEDVWTIEVHESTANGKDPFFFPLCEEAANPDSSSAYRLIFLPWFLTPEYSMTWEVYRRELLHSGKKDPGLTFVPTQAEEALRAKLSTQIVLPHEKFFRYRTDLTDEQLIWRRFAKATRCRNDENELARYYPSFYEECFTASTTSFFDAETIHFYRVSARAPSVQGDFLPAWTVLPAPAPIKIWDFPKPGLTYTIGADPGGERTDRDPSCAYVVCNQTKEVVAQIFGHLSAHEFTKALSNLGHFYNRAYVIVENNFNPSVANELHRAGYPNLYYYFKDAQIEARVGRSPGFSTNKKTRPEILGNLRYHCQERLFFNPDPEFWKEQETLVFVPRGGSLNPDRDGDYRAIGRNHDDRIMAAALALSPFMKQDRPPESAAPPDPLVNRSFRFFLSMQEEESKRAPGSVIL